jgi:aldose 1-epimerase
MAVITLGDGTVTAGLRPDAGMVMVSLRADGVELLGQGKGLDEYTANGTLFGLPFLHPWANRLSAFGFDAHGRSVTLTPHQVGLCTDERGTPIHGLLAAHPGWVVESLTGDEVVAVLDFASYPELLASFPFPHEVSMRVSVRDRVLTVTTTVTATSDVPVPLSFGYHPYFVIPGVPREQWVLETPAMRHLGMDERLLPTGIGEQQEERVVELGRQVFDDGYDMVADGAVFAVSGGGRRIVVRFDHGYPAAQIYAPIDQDVVCVEPMTAPTDALRRGGYRSVPPGESVDARFSIEV